MSKKALCVNAADLPFQFLSKHAYDVMPLPTNFWDLDVFAVDRAVCETDARTMQLLPYNVLLHNGTVFTYERNTNGGEARLHGNTSVGVGGHVDHVPPQGVGLKLWLQMEAAREILEKVQVIVRPKGIEFVGAIVDRSNDVGRVHLGLLAFVNVKADGVLGVEAEAIVKGRFATPKDLYDGLQMLENWSKLVVCSDELQQALRVHG